MRHSLLPVLTCVLLAGCAASVTPEAPPAVPEAPAPQAAAPEPQQEQMPAPNPEVRDAGGGWSEYRSAALGFSMRLPSAVRTPDGQAVPLTVFNGSDGRTVYVAPAAWTVPGAQGLAAVTVQALEQNAAAVPNWQITVAPVPGDADLERFLRDRFGRDCRVGVIRPSEQEGTLEVETGGAVPGNPDCTVNGTAVAKYSSTLGKAAGWTVAAGGTFPTPDGAMRDPEMVRSFRFE